MFDVVLAAPFKHYFHIYYKQEFAKARTNAKNASVAQRIRIINATILAWRTVANVENCQTSERKAGLTERIIEKFSIILLIIIILTKRI